MSETDEEIGVLERTKRFVSENRAGTITGGITLLLAAVLFWALLNTASQPKEKEAPPPLQIQIQRPKPPPPPPPPKTPQIKPITPPKQETPVQKTFTPHTPPKPSVAKPPGPTQQQTSIHNDTSSGDFAGLAQGSGDGMVGGTGGGGGGGSYEGAIAADIEAALSRNPDTRNANAGLQVRIWLNADGTITQVEIMKSSGDSSVDNAVKNQVLAGMQLPAPPPGTGMPIIMSLTGQQPL